MWNIIGIELGGSKRCTTLIEGGQPLIVPGSNKEWPDASPAHILHARKSREISGRTWSPEEQAALFLRTMKLYAEEYLGENVADCVVSIPGCFSYPERQSIRDSAKIAGLNVVRLISWPVACSLSYLMKDSREQIIACIVCRDSFIDVAILDWCSQVAEVLFECSMPFPGKENADSATSEGKFSKALEEVLYHLNTDFQSYKEDWQGKEPVADVDTCLFLVDSYLSTDVMSLARQFFSGASLVRMPEESPALGAGYLAGKLCGEPGCQDLLLLDIRNASLSIETQGGVAFRLIERNSVIPTKKIIEVSTSADNQPAIDISVYEGEAEFAKDNTLIGHIRLSGIKPAAKGVPRITVSLSVDTNDTISVSAIDNTANRLVESRLIPTSLTDDIIYSSKAFLEKCLQSLKTSDAFEKKQSDTKEPQDSFSVAMKSSQIDINPSLASSSGISYAEFENYRQRAEKEKASRFDDGVKSILTKILPVIDNFERALDAAAKNPAADQYAEGVSLIYRQLLKNLAESGVTKIECVGKPFDPALHAAVMHVDDPSVGQNIVIEELQKGYMYKGSVLRHSMVKVAN